MQLSRRRLIAVAGVAGASGCLHGPGDEGEAEDDEGNDTTDAGDDGDGGAGEVDVEVLENWSSFHRDEANTGYVDVEAPRSDVEASTFEVGGPVNSSPAAVDGRVYFGSTDGSLYCVDGDGFVWSHDTGARTVSSPAVHDGTVYVGNDDGYLLSVDAEEGTRNWRLRVSGRLHGSPTVDPDGSRVYFGTTEDAVYAVDPGREREDWSYTVNEEVETTPALLDGFLYVTTRGAAVYRVDAETGERLNSHSVGDGVRSSPAAVERDGRHLVCFGSEDEKLYAVEFYRDAGVPQVERRWTFPTDGAVRSSPAVSEDSVYVGGDDGTVYAVSLDGGSEIWSHDTGGRVRSSPAVSGDAVYVGSDDGIVYALDAADGELLWSHETGDVVRSSPSVPGSVHVGSADSSLYSFR